MFPKSCFGRCDSGIPSGLLDALWWNWNVVYPHTHNRRKVIPWGLVLEPLLTEFSFISSFISVAASVASLNRISPLKQPAQDKTWSQNFPSSFSVWLLARALSSCDRHHYLHLGTSYHCEWQLIGHSTKQDPEPFLKSSSSSSFCSRKRVQVVPTQHKTTATEVWRRALNQYLYLSHQLPVINNRTQTHTYPLTPTVTRVQYFDWFISIHYAP